MNSLFKISLHSTSILLKSNRLIANSISTPLYGCSVSLSWKRNVSYAGIRSINLESVLSRFRFQCYSSSSKSSRKRKSEAKTAMEREKDAFFVVRKGDIVGVYKTLSECQAQVGSSVCDPPVSVYKGYSLPKDAEDHLRSLGLQNALYTIKASDLREDLFGDLMPCSFQEPSSFKGETSSKDLPQKRLREAQGSEDVEAVASANVLTDPKSKHKNLNVASSDSRFCVLEFDGASKGNPGPAGAGAVLKTNEGSLICKLCQGLGTATNNVAEYRAVILGLKKALEKGYTSIRVLGDSKLVCMQLQGLWKVKNQNISALHEEATKLKNKFLSFHIGHVLRDLNSDADVQANLAIRLADGQIQEDLL